MQDEGPLGVPPAFAGQSMTRSAGLKGAGNGASRPPSSGGDAEAKELRGEWKSPGRPAASQPTAALWKAYCRTTCLWRRWCLDCGDHNMEGKAGSMRKLSTQRCLQP